MILKVLKLLISLFLKEKKQTIEQKSENKPEEIPEAKQQPVEPKEPHPKPSLIQLITVEAVATSSGRYPDRAKSPEYTQTVIGNINQLILPVNALLNEIGVKRVDITSGFRTQASNDATANSARRSNHMLGKAVDILDDKDQSLAKKITLDLLEKYDLYMEDPDFTKGKNTNWVHLQIAKTGSGRRIFKP